MLKISTSLILACLITFGFTYFIFFGNLPDPLKEQGYLSLMLTQPAGFVGGFIGAYIASYYSFSPAVLTIPARLQESLGKFTLSTQPIKTNGRINSIEKQLHTTILTIAYDGHTKAFTLDNEVFHTPLTKGQSIVIFYDPNKKDQAYLDLLADSTEKTQTIESISSSDTMFKLLEITPEFSLGTGMYEVFGEIYGEKYEGQKAKFAHQFGIDDLSSLIPGRILPCRINGNGDNLSISLILNKV